MNDFVLKLICENMHVTETPAINPVQNEDGSWDFSAGSAADFCLECESEKMTYLELQVPRTSA